MKTLVCLMLSAGVLAGPSLSFAQSPSAPLTRAQVLADLVRIEQAGYNPAMSNDSTYPSDIQAAEAKIAAQDNKQQAAATTQVGSLQTSAPASASPAGSVVASH